MEVDACSQGFVDSVSLWRWWGHMTVPGDLPTKVFRGLLFILIPLFVLTYFFPPWLVQGVHLIVGRFWSAHWNSKALTHYKSLSGEKRTTQDKAPTWLTIFLLHTIYPIIIGLQGLLFAYLVLPITNLLPLHPMIQYFLGTLPLLWEAWSQGTCICFAVYVDKCREADDLKTFMKTHSDYILAFGLPSVLVAKLAYLIRPWAVVEMAVLDIFFVIQTWNIVETEFPESGSTSSLMVCYPLLDFLVSKMFKKKETVKKD
eukprot:TRINITY_DN5328_c0_g1_i1.p1 TRINITY_DN5328_c0_g1~~TRINITY_DN5328_c0_g1_i1.p1  ORF type:complete len:258 (+),score=50.42 TRINITY_DN5328_c0_g1_i1:126-899(+)